MKSRGLGVPQESRTGSGERHGAAAILTRFGEEASVKAKLSWSRGAGLAKCKYATSIYFWGFFRAYDLNSQPKSDFHGRQQSAETFLDF